MGDAEFVTKVECITMHRQQDQKVNDEVEKLRTEFDAKIERIYEKIDRVFWAAIALLITSLVSIVLFLATTVFSHVKFG